jgi:hypothetical protein
VITEFEFTAKDYQSHPDSTVSFTAKNGLALHASEAGIFADGFTDLRFEVISAEPITVGERSARVTAYVVRRTGKWVLQAQQSSPHPVPAGVPAKAYEAMRKQVFTAFTESVTWDELRMLLLRGFNRHLSYCFSNLEESMVWDGMDHVEQVRQELNRIKAATSLKAVLCQTPTEQEFELAAELLEEYYHWDNPLWPDTSTLMGGIHGAFA